MPTYLIKSEKKITRQEGDHADVVFNIPEILPTEGALFSFKVYSKATGIGDIFSKSTDVMDIAGQTIIIYLEPTDTTNCAGVHRWELQGNFGGQIITLGKGDFEILKQKIK